MLSRKKESKDMRINTIPLIGGGQAFFCIPASLSAANYEHIGKWLDLMEPALTKTQLSNVEKDAIFKRAQERGVGFINHLERRRVAQCAPEVQAG